MAVINKLLQCKCPKCGEGKIFQYDGNIFLLKAPVMHEQCPVCEYRFEKEPGYFIGSLYVSYGLAVGELMVLFAILYFLLSFYALMVAMLLSLVLLTFINFRYARTIWIYIFQY